MKKYDVIINHDLLLAQKTAYEVSGLMCSNIERETESQDYGACTFTMNNRVIKFRTAKITPTKIGQFVTLWKRVSSGVIAPYDMQDAFDLFVISVCNIHNVGQFVFPKELLFQKGFVSKDGKGGKRAMRVYPPWDIPNGVEAQKTQAWQLPYFVEIQPNLDKTHIEKLFR